MYVGLYENNWSNVTALFRDTGQSLEHFPAHHLIRTSGPGFEPAPYVEARLCQD